MLETCQRQKDGAVAEVGDTGFYHPVSLVEGLFWVWDASERRLLPCGGTWFDQDVLLLHDLYAFSHIVAWARKTLEPPKADKPNPAMPGGATSWQW